MNKVFFVGKRTVTLHIPNKFYFHLKIYIIIGDSNLICDALKICLLLVNKM